MRIRELTIQAFEEYTKNSPLKNYMQSEEYARFMGENKYNYDYVGLVDDANVIVAASLILWKKIGLNMRYGYAPKGFLLNYYDEKILSTFTQKIAEFYSKKNMAFIKINPEIVVGEYDAKTLEYKSNPNSKLKIDIQKYGYMKLKDNVYFESMVPRFNAYVDLKNARLENYSKANRNKVRNSKRKGLYIELGTETDLEKFAKMSTFKRPVSYYRTMYNLFKDKMELILVKVNFEEYIKNSQSLYETELDHNSLYNEILHRSHKESDLHRKMASDSRLCTIKNEIMHATDGIREHDNEIVAAALVVKYENRVHIIESAFDREFASLNANYFLYDALIENYKYDFEYLDLNGISGDFKETNPYRGLNRFKMGFNPKIYEFIGEFDLVLNRNAYDNLLATGRLSDEFNKKDN
ncbi:MAG TPA: hypothetical protein DCY94_02905 [Firmicutes bacterium]|nr:hypothetical protein [Bacillota bacterium]